MLLRREELELQLELPINWFLRRRKSGWLDADELINVLRLLAEILRDLTASYHFILSMDASPVHLSAKVAAACAQLGLHVIYIPAFMTPWLQPCDTHLFAMFKRSLAAACEEAQGSSLTGEVISLTMLRIVMRAARAVIETRSWRVAFQKTGLCDQQRGVALVGPTLVCLFTTYRRSLV